jgi:predicted phage tail protein
MDPITRLISELVTSGAIADTTLLLVILGLMFWGYRNVLSPLVKKVDSIASADTIEEQNKEVFNKTELSFEDISKKLVEVEKKLDEVEEYLKIEVRDHEQLKRDLDTIKTILNQFQGHMLYNNHGSKNGNQELR